MVQLQRKQEVIHNSKVADEKVALVSEEGLQALFSRPARHPTWVSGVDPGVQFI